MKYLLIFMQLLSWRFSYSDEIDSRLLMYNRDITLQNRNLTNCFILSECKRKNSDIIEREIKDVNLYVEIIWRVFASIFQCFELWIQTILKYFLYFFKILNVPCASGLRGTAYCALIDVNYWLSLNIIIFFYIRRARKT